MKQDKVHWERRAYIENFCEDLNYQGIILYVADVNLNKLRERIEKDYINKMWRFDYMLDKQGDASKRYYMYIENCDFQDLDFPITDYIEEGYMVVKLYEDETGFYIKDPLH